MNRASILWVVVVLCAGGAIAVRVVRQRSTGPTIRTTAPRPVAAPMGVHDYVAEPIVHPDERENGPASIISLAPSLTETCCALGLLDRLVGRTAFCVNPPAVRRVQNVGTLVDANFELIASIHPEMLLMAETAGRLREHLDPLGIPYYEVTDDSLEGLFAGIRTIGRLADRPRTAAMLVVCLEQELAAITEQHRTTRPQRVLLIFDAMPVPPAPLFVAGQELFLSELVTRLGHRNAAAELVKEQGVVRSGELSLEQLVTLDPDVILELRPDATPEAMEAMYTAWAEVGPMRAIANRAVRSYGTKENLVLSPRINIVYRELAQALEDWR
jgi:ABC-type hemin transport system substrate-binding protein